MDSPDQRAFNIATNSTKVEVNKLEIKTGSITYTGELIGNQITGTFTQGAPFPLNLVPVKAIVPARPQEPKAPFPYFSEDLTFENKKAGISLGATLTLPKNTSKAPVVILITGSGPEDRNEEIFGHKPFMIIADYLTKNGIAVLRYDDRGVGKSGGLMEGSTSADFATDVEAAMAYLKTRIDIDPTKIGLLGHSEGGLIAAIVASRNNDISFVVSLAGPGVSGYEITMDQVAKGLKSAGLNEAMRKESLDIQAKILDEVRKEQSVEQLRKQLNQIFVAQLEVQKTPQSEETQLYINRQIAGLSSPWYLYFTKTNAADYYQTIKCPVLALNGEKDTQVDAELNISGIKKALSESGNKRLEILRYKDLNHLFQQCTTGEMSEYGKIEQTISPEVLKDISTWILKQTGN